MQSGSHIGTHSKRTVLGICSIVLVTFAIYIPAIKGGFIWNDDTFLTNNPLIKASDGLYCFWFTTEQPDYFPLTSTSLWLEWRLWGMNALGYHLVNVLLHATSSVLIWFILRRLMIPGAWLAGLFFAVHPVNVESVAWITERKNVLPMVFYLSSILLYLRFERDEQPWVYGLSLGSFFAALLAKTSVAMQPFVLLGCAWWQRGRIVGKDMLRTIPFFVLSLAMSLTTIWFQYNRAIGKDIVVRADSFFSRLAGAGLAVWFYLYKAVVPCKLTFIYPKWHIDESSFIYYLPGLLLLGLFIILYNYRDGWGRPFFFALSYYVIALFPVLGFFNIYFMKYSLVADHWQYTSIMGVIALSVGLGAYAYRASSKALRHLLIIAVIVIFGLLSFQTLRQCFIYQSVETLWRDTILKNQNAWLAHYNLGNHLARQGRIKEAIDRYSDALKVKPDYSEAHNNLGALLAHKGDIDEAISHLSEALRIDPKNPRAHFNLGIALEKQGNLEQAIVHFSEALRIRPSYTKAQFYLERLLRLNNKPRAASP